MIGALLSFLVFAVALAIRIYLNRGQTWGTPDEKTYSTYAQTWRPGSKYRGAVKRFIDAPGLDIPPTRYGFFAVCSGVVALLKKPAYQTLTWVAAASGALCAPLAFQITDSLPASLLIVSSALSLILSRRALQDTFAALMVMLALWAIHLQSVSLFGVAVLLMLATREALLLYLPAIGLAWWVATGKPVMGALAGFSGGLAAIGLYHLLGGRWLVSVFRKLRQPTDYVRRLQSGMNHRVLVDLVLVSPITVVGAIVASQWAPLWLTAFTGVALATHACITPKNVRFLLILDLSTRMLCAWLPGPWSWTVLGFGAFLDWQVFRAIKETRDTVTYNLVVKLGMYLEK